MSAQGKYEQSIAGVVYAVEMLRNGMNTYDVSAYRYAAGSYHHMPAFDRVEPDEHAAKNGAGIIFAMLRIQAATNAASKSVQVAG